VPGKSSMGPSIKLASPWTPGTPVPPGTSGPPSTYLFIVVPDVSIVLVFPIVALTFFYIVVLFLLGVVVVSILSICSSVHIPPLATSTIGTTSIASRTSITIPTCGIGKIGTTGTVGE